MTEQDYDEQIAPLLADIANKIGELGGSIVARVEWAPDESGTTALGVTEKSGIGQILVAHAATCNGNLDSLYITLARRYDLSATVVGRMMGCTLPKKTEDNETV